MARKPVMHRDIVVVGASAGGVEALTRLVAQLPEDFPAAVLVVLHLSAGHRSLLPEILSRAGPLPAIHPKPETELEPGRIYVAPTDRHLLVEPGRVLVNSGPRENGHRPAVDPLFRSAARAYGPRVIGVVLTGALDCGTSGLMAVKAQGGLAIVQDPEDAYCPDMPRNALEYVKVDHKVKLAELGALLVRLVSAPLPPHEVPKPSLRLEEEVTAMREVRGIHTNPRDTGSPSLFSCPDCGGVLFEMDEEGLLRYRCRVGHGFTAKALSVTQQAAMDGALWAALRALEESAALSRRMAARARERTHDHSARRYEERARATEEQAELVRQMVMHNTTRPPPEELPEEEGPKLMDV
ncbi:chemotaxis protein CheB [Cystobacter fuscus]|uniref:chemotaxis protein CheB n=1 Tax=Cystobacter fuscus TaxID=43 RepID=UPI002B2B323D|nr:chemotaxis protein CheB [Cystobacter fuscus]